MVLSMRRMPPFPRGKGQAWRAFALVMVLCAVVWGFWKNTERQMDHILQRGLVVDETDTLNTDQLANLREMVSALKSTYGVKAAVHVFKEEIIWPEDSDSPLQVFLGVVPDKKEAVLSFSPLLRRGLGEEFCYQLQHVVLSGYVEKDDIFHGLAECLTRLWHRLGAIS